MTDARRVDLNYGHFGEPTYDLESQEWRFSRNVDEVPELLVLGQPRTLISSPPSTSSPTSPAQTFSQRAQNIDKLIRHRPEIAPSSWLLPPLAEASEANQDPPADCNQALSERVAFGRALHPGRYPNHPSTVSVVAFVGGAAGDLVRVVQLTRETLGLDGRVNLRFQGEVFQSRVQGLWHTSRGPVQQLQFANSHGEPTEWLAVRHGGATSILRIVLRESEVPTLYRIPHVPTIGPDVEIRMELEHVVVLPVQSAGDALHTDTCFNPWQVSEIAVLDQSSHWKVWKIKSLNKHTRVWTIETMVSGYLMEEGSDDVDDSDDRFDTKKYDGWGALRFVGNGAYLLVCNRKHIACFDLQGQPACLQTPELGLKKSADWILDVRRVSTQLEYIFMTTSSRIFWIHLALEHFESTEQPRLSAKTLLVWRHFRSMEDFSLSTQIMSLPPNIVVLLYSPLTGLKTVFTLDQAGHFPSSDFNPYLIRMPSHEDSEAACCSTIVLQVVRQDGHRHSAENEGSSPHQEDSIRLLRCLMLNSDLNLRESYLVTSFPGVLPQTLGAPRSLGRPRPPRSSYRVADNFIIPNGLLDDDAQERSVQAGSSSIQESNRLSVVRPRNSSPTKDQWTINFEWLKSYISSPGAPSLDERLQPVLGRLDDNLSGERLASLGELIGQEVAISEVDQGSRVLADFLSSLENGQPPDELESVLVFKLTSPSLLPSLHTSLETSLSQVYHSLIQSWITSLTARLPRRTGTGTESLVRLIATQLQLAGTGMSRSSTGNQPEGKTTNTGNMRPFIFTLPVRQAASSSDKALQEHPEHLYARPTASEDENFVPAATLPTPEPTPSLRSQGSRSSLGESEDSEDTCTRTFSPGGRVAMGILSHWALGQEPDDKNWEISMMDDDRGDIPKDATEKRRKRKRRDKDQMAQAQDTEVAGPSSQPMAPRLVASQDNMATDGLVSSQPRPLFMSQPQPGRHGGGRQSKKAKKAGFR